MTDLIERIGPYLGIAAFLGLAILAFLIFQQAREVRRLREWAGARARARRRGRRGDGGRGRGEGRGGADAEEVRGADPGRGSRAGSGATRDWFSDRWAAVDRRSPVDPRYIARRDRGGVIAAGVLTSGFGLRRRRRAAAAAARRRPQARRRRPRRSRSRSSTRPRTRRSPARSRASRASPARSPSRSSSRPASRSATKADAPSGLRRDRDHVRAGARGRGGQARRRRRRRSSATTEVEPMTDEIARSAGEAPLALVIGPDDADVRRRARHARASVGRDLRHGHRLRRRSAPLLGADPADPALPLAAPRRAAAARVDGARARLRRRGPRRQRGAPRPRRDRARGARRAPTAVADARARRTPASGDPGGDAGHPASVRRSSGSRWSERRCSRIRAGGGSSPARPSRGCWSRSASARAAARCRRDRRLRRSCSPTTTRPQRPQVGAIDPATSTVAVLNGTSVNGLAGKVGSDVEANGYTLGAITNTDARLQEDRGHLRATARSRRRRRSPGTSASTKVQPLDRDLRDSWPSDADVVVIAGEDRA